MKILNLKENKDGSAIMTYSLNSDEEIIFKTLLKRRNKRFTHKNINSLILKGLDKYIKENK